MDIKGLFVWTVGLVIRVTQLFSTLKKQFFSYPSITWITHLGSVVMIGFLQLLEWLGSLVFYLFLVSISLAYISRNAVTMGLRANTSDKNPKPT